MRVLIVRLSSLGDLVHTIPMAASLHDSVPDGRIDWLVDERYRSVIERIPIVDRVWTLPRTPLGALGLVGALRAEAYDVAVDAQGLLKSAVLARLSGARRVIGFSVPHLRETAAGLFYTDRPGVGPVTHIVGKNLALLRGLKLDPEPWGFPIDVPPSSVPGQVRETLGLTDGGRFALLNPGAAWPSKRWMPERFGELAARLADEHRLRSVVSWGPGEEDDASRVVASSAGAAVMAPRTTLDDLMALLQAARVVVSGDTGPLHLAAALSTPVVGIYGPSNPDRNGPWAPTDVVVTRYDGCACRSGPDDPSRGFVVRECRQTSSCLADITVGEVAEAVTRRLGGVERHA
jgi:heptosyltransferase-1